MNKCKHIKTKQNGICVRCGFNTLGLANDELKALDYRKELKEILHDKTSCRLQHDGWTCGTCFYSLSKRFTNKDWQTVLFVRGDYKKSELDLNFNVLKRVERIINILKSI